MTDTTTLSNVAEIIGAAIVVGGVYFAVPQMRQQRRELDATRAFEWFQWLADRLEDHEKTGDHRKGPAYITETDWLPSHMQDGF